MEWIDVNNAEIKIPFTKVCVWDGGNTFWAYLQRKEISSAGMNLIWHIDTPPNYGICVPLFWMKVTHP
jgi:hypothetical protein